MDMHTTAPKAELKAPTPANAVPLLTLSGVSKSFPGVRALHDVSLSLYPGQVTALIGENGAGKSTLVKILTGIYQPDSGDISVSGEPVHLSTAHKAFEHGITAIHQETVLFDDLTVAENIFLGHAPRTRFGTIDWKTMHANAREVLDTMHAGHIDADARLRDLGIANKHLVAVARAMSIDARIVIMDEPTAALSAKEIEELFLLIEFLKSEGKAILFISHKFDEIFRIADRYTVFRDGEMVGEGFLADASQGAIVKMMVGRAIDHIFPQREPNIGAPVLAVSDLSHPTEFDGISFELRKGEILGFYGLVGAGRSELMQAIFGITRTSRGAISLDGAAIHPKSAADAIEAGIVYVPEERGRQGVVTGMPIFKNVSLPSLQRTSKSGVLRLKEEFDLARRYTGRLDLRASSLSQDVGTLSGGNQQKVVIAKWLMNRPRIILLNDPTRGIDVGTKQEIYLLLRKLADAGAAIIFYSTDYDELIGCCDRVLVMYDGSIIRELEGAEINAHELIGAALNIAGDHAAQRIAT
jgi:rhamnose transport system ATP-binding protein